jgi:adenosylcobinamide-GDP ribazoletransferase
MREAWRLAVGTLTAVPVTPPARVDALVAGRAMLLAPVAVVPLGAVVVLLGWLGARAGVSPHATAFLAVGALAAGSRALHWDGLSDTADGLTASYDRERSLAVMKSGAAGPAGVVAVVVVVGLQVSGLVGLLTTSRGAVLAGVLVCASRAALTITCLAGVPAARRDGLGLPHAGTVGRPAAVASWVAVAVTVAASAWWADLDWWRGVVAVLLAGAVVAVLLRRAVRRFGGVTGDVYGASIELALATLLVSLS